MIWTNDEEFEVGQIIKVKVTKIWKNVIYLTTKNNNRCFLNINEVSDYYIKDIKNMFKIGSIKEVVIIDIMATGELVVSFKRIHPKELKNPFEFKLDSDKDNKFEALLDFVNKGIRYGK